MSYSKMLGSSVNPEQLSLTIQGAITSIAPILLAVLGFSGIHISTDGFNVAIDGVLEAIQAITTFVSVGVVAYGLSRKAVMRIINLFK